ncbi:uncharacterized protein LOC111104056 isoform X2 [Crassostrea virginica]
MNMQGNKTVGPFSTTEVSLPSKATGMSEGRPGLADYDNHGFMTVKVSIKEKTQTRTQLRLPEPSPDYPTTSDQKIHIDPETNHTLDLGDSNDSGATSGYERIQNASAGDQKQIPQEPLPDYPSGSEKEIIPRNFPRALAYNSGIFGSPFCKSTKSTILAIEDDPRYNAQELKQKKKRCGWKFCFYTLWIILFLGISGIVAFTVISKEKTDDVESLTNSFPEKLQGQDEKIRNVNHSIVQAVNTLNGALKSFKIGSQRESGMNFSNVTEKLFNELKGKMIELFKDLKKNLTEYQVDSSTESSQDNRVDGNCINGTVGNCVSSCYNLCDGNYQSCRNCREFVQCANRHLFTNYCNLNLVWDDTRKRCEGTSNTCT